MNFDDFWKNETGPAHFAGEPTAKDLARAAWNRAAELEREECARAAEGFTEERDDRKWVPGSLYDTLRRETAAFIRKRSNA